MPSAAPAQTPPAQAHVQSQAQPVQAATADEEALVTFVNDARASLETIRDDLRRAPRTGASDATIDASLGAAASNLLKSVQTVVTAFRPIDRGRGNTSLREEVLARIRLYQTDLKDQVTAGKSANVVTAWAPLDNALDEVQRQYALLARVGLDDQALSEAFLSRAQTAEDNWGRFRADLLGGVVVSQRNGDFSQTSVYLRFVGDTAWGNPWKVAEESRDKVRANSSDFHTWIDLSLVPIPTEKPATSGTTTQEVVDSKKAATGSLGMDWRFVQLPDIGGHRFFVGPTARAGIQTITEDNSAAKSTGVNTVNNYFGGGIRLGEYLPSLTAREGEPKFNPKLFRYVDVTYGNYQNFGTKRVTVEAMLRFKPTDSDISYFIGSRGIFGPGKDDLQIMAGIDVSFGKLSKIIKGLVPSFLTD
jgi:hypothetical protein